MQSKFIISFFIIQLFLFPLNAQVLPTYGIQITEATLSSPVNLALPVGMATGQAGVSNTGAATYELPVTAPAGSAGIRPQISLVYNSQAGDVNVGMGWNISGLSVIARSTRNWYHDGKVAPVEYSYNDAFVLDGQRLVLISGDNGKPGAIYSTENESYSKITAMGAAGNGPAWWQVWRKDGTVMEFGNSTDARFMTDGAAGSNDVMMWRLNRIIDINGNYINFIYTNSDRSSRIDYIEYTGNDAAGITPFNKIKFNYDERWSKNLIYEQGASIRNNWILNEIVITGEGGSLMKKFAFQYFNDNRNSFLQRIEEFGSDGISKLNQTIFKYGDKTDAIATSEIGTFIDAYDLRAADVDADGLDDIIAVKKVRENGSFGGYPWYADHNVGIEIIKKSSSYPWYYLADTINIPVTYTPGLKPQKANNPAVFNGDFNGDGYEDIAIAYFTYGSERNYYNFTKIYLSNGNGTFDKSLPGVSHNFSYANLIKEKSFFFPGDFDGDGRCDYILFYNGRAYMNSFGLGEFNIPLSGLKAGYYNPWEPAADPYIVNTPICMSDKSFVIDFDGDGKHELMFVKDNKTYIFTFKKLVSGEYEAMLLAELNYPTSAHEIRVGDFNGDGKTDLLTKTNPIWQVAYSTGKDFQIENFSFDESVDPDYPNRSQIVLADYNGDRKTDIMHGYQTETGGVNKTKYVIYYSYGNGFSRKEYMQLANPEVTNMIAGDFNGDGKSDVVNQRYHHATLKVWDISHFNNNTKDLQLEKIRDGFGNITTLQYKNLTSGITFYMKGGGGAYPLNDIQYPINAVSSVTSPNGIGGFSTTSYKYEGAKLHRAGRGFLGFSKITAQNSTADIKTIKENSIDGTFYVPYETKNSAYQLSTGALLSEQVQNSAFVSLGGKRFFFKINGITTTDGLTGAVTTVNNTWDDVNGNITGSTKNTGGVETAVTNTSYITVNSPVATRPSSVTVTNTRTGQPSVSKTTEFTYLPNGLVQTMKEFPGMSGQLLTTYEYYQPGTLKKKYTIAGALGTAPDKMSYTYDSKHRFPVSTQDILGLTTTVAYDNIWGKPSAITGTDGLTQTYAYDAFGRQTATTVNSGTANAYTITTSYLWNTSGPGRWYIYTQHPGAPDVKTYYDIQGREVKQEAEHYGGQWTTALTTYDVRGNAITKTTPYLPSETPITTTSTFDALNRLISSDNGLTSTAYTYSYTGGNSKVTQTPASGAATSTTTDATGKVIETTDGGGTMTYKYDSRGAQTIISTSASPVYIHKNTYDAYGYKTQTWNQSSGTVSYGYNAFGQITSQATPKGTTTFTYDIAGRLTDREGPEGHAIYQYYPTTDVYYRRGKRSGITGPGPLIEQYNYNQYGLTSSVSRIMPGVLYNTLYEYDAFNNPTKITYPSGIAIRNTYDANGFLQNVTNDAGTVSYFQAQAVTGLGQYSKYKLGNGLTTNIGYTNGMPTTLTTPGIQKYTLNWDYSTGNLMSRIDITANRSEFFTYDNLNRLTKSTVIKEDWLAGTSTFVMPPTQITYDAGGKGNFEEKSDVGSYLTHGSNNQVLGVTNSSALIASIAQNITYTPFLKTEKVTEGDKELSFVYGPDRERRLSTYKVGGVVQETRYYGEDGYEKYTDNTGTVRQLHYIMGGDGVCAVIVRTGSTDVVFYVYKDHLGSWLTLTNASGSIVARQSFDAWGRRRNPATWNYAAIPAVPSWLNHGFTGHEHHDDFGLINMNARMYDPLLGRMCAPDNLLHPQYGTQGFNRYSYVVNNPLKYTDPEGEWIHIVIGAVVGGVINLGVKAYQSGGKISFMDGLAAFGIGAVAGAVGAATGGAAFLAAGGAAGGAGGFLAGAAGGAVGNAFASPVLSMGNSAYFGDPFLTPGQWAIGVGIGAVTGGVTNGALAAFNGRSFMTGDLKVSSLGFSSMESIPASGYKEVGKGFRSPNELRGNTYSNNDVFRTPSINYEKVYEKLLNHSFSRQHVRDGVLTIGSGTRIGTADLAVKVLEFNQRLLIEGSNEIIVNGGQFTVRCFVQNGQVISANIFLGGSTRGLGNIIYFRTH